MLIRNNTRIVERVIVDLFFDDNSEKHIEISEKDIVSVSYNDNGYRKTIEGKVTKIVSGKNKPTVHPSQCYPVSNGYPIPHKTSEGYFIVDGSDVYDNNRVIIYFSNILDCEMIEKYDESLIVKTVSGNGAVQKIRINEETNILEVSKDGITWIDVSTLIKNNKVEENIPENSITDNNSNSES